MLVLGQKMSFPTKSMTRLPPNPVALLMVLLTTPKLLLPLVVLGLANCGVLVALNHSVRMSSLNRSLSLIVRESVTFKLKSPGP